MTGLRVVHAVVFLGFAAAAVAGTQTELLQLWRGLTQHYSGGSPPSPIACAGGLLAGTMALVVLARLVTKKGTPLAISLLLLVGFVASMITFTLKPTARTVPGANVKSLEAAVALHGKLNGPLQADAKVPDLAKVTLEGDTPFYRRPFEPLQWHVAQVKRTDALPDGAEPGWLLCEVTEDRVAFTITAVGIDAEGEPSLLRQDGKPIEYRGAYNPDTPR